MSFVAEAVLTFACVVCFLVVAAKAGWLVAPINTAPTTAAAVRANARIKLYPSLRAPVVTRLIIIAIFRWITGVACCAQVSQKLKTQVLAYRDTKMVSTLTPVAPHMAAP